MTFTYGNNGEEEIVTAFAIKDIKEELPHVNVGPVITLFKGIKLHDIKHPSGQVDLLPGMHESHLFPAHALQSRDNILLYQLTCGTGLLLVGHHPPTHTRGGPTVTARVQEGAIPGREAGQSHLPDHFRHCLGDGKASEAKVLELVKK